MALFLLTIAVLNVVLKATGGWPTPVVVLTPSLFPEFAPTASPAAPLSLPETSIVLYSS